MSSTKPSTRPLEPAPIRLADFDLLKKTALFTDEDERYLRMSQPLVTERADEILDVWYGFVGSNPHLLQYFARPSDGQPIERYLSEVRKRFRQWILDTAAAQYDQRWLDYQFEIGRRHHRSGKNQTDSVDAVEHIPLRYLTTLIFPIVTTLRPFLATKAHSESDVQKMHEAWMKSALLQVTLWCYPYVKPGDF